MKYYSAVETIDICDVMDTLQDIMLSAKSQAQNTTYGMILFFRKYLEKGKFLEKCSKKWLPEAGNKNGD